MKTLMNGLLKGRITRWGFLAVLLIAAGATVGWKNQRQYQLGGGWIGSNGAGNIWNALQIPLDPAGRTAALRVNLTTYNANNAGLLSLFGANSQTEAVGEMEMISRDTAKYGTVYYLQQQGNPPTLCAIVVMTGTIKFTGPDNMDVAYTATVYSPSADADKDGFPDAGVPPAFPPITDLDTAKRVPTR
jgi:hypothetical protein